MDQSGKNMGQSEQPESSGVPDSGLQALRTIRHDFKTPLTSLRILGQIFQTSLEKGTLTTQPERTERNCRLLVEQIDKLVGLSDNLYEIAVALSGNLKLEKQHADLRPILSDAIARFDTRVHDVELPPLPVWGDWDVGKLTHAFACLLAEAVSVTVKMAADSSDPGTMRVVISGEFRPINDKIAPGRYIATQIIEKHGGVLQNRFEVQLPVKAQQ